MEVFESASRNSHGLTWDLVVVVDGVSPEHEATSGFHSRGDSAGFTEAPGCSHCLSLRWTDGWDDDAEVEEASVHTQERFIKKLGDLHVGR